MGRSNVRRTQPRMQRESGHTAPQIPPRGLLPMMIVAARRKSEGVPTLHAIIKSAGEQSAGHASLQGFSSQYSHRAISVWNCASLRSANPTDFFMAHPEGESPLESTTSLLHYQIRAFCEWPILSREPAGSCCTGGKSFISNRGTANVPGA